MTKKGFRLEREGNNWYLKKGERPNEIVLFLNREKYTTSSDNFTKLHIREYCNFRAWGDRIGSVKIGGDVNWLPFSLVEDYLDFFNKWHDRLEEIEGIENYTQSF